MYVPLTLFTIEFVTKCHVGLPCLRDVYGTLFYLGHCIAAVMAS